MSFPGFFVSFVSRVKLVCGVSYFVLKKFIRFFIAKNYIRQYTKVKIRVQMHFFPVIVSVFINKTFLI